MGSTNEWVAVSNSRFEMISGTRPQLRHTVPIKILDKKRRVCNRSKIANHNKDHKDVFPFAICQRLFIIRFNYHLKNVLQMHAIFEVSCPQYVCTCSPLFFILLVQIPSRHKIKAFTLKSLWRTLPHPVGSSKRKPWKMSVQVASMVGRSLSHSSVTFSAVGLPWLGFRYFISRAALPSASSFLLWSALNSRWQSMNSFTRSKLGSCRSTTSCHGTRD